VPVCVYAFDLLSCRRVIFATAARPAPGPAAALTRSKGDLIRFSEAFPDANVLLAECVRLGLEGIVAKRKDAAYRSGSRSGWIKVKTSEWKAASRYRAKLFQKG
jgi:hypothetical protein